MIFFKNFNSKYSYILYKINNYKINELFFFRIIIILLFKNFRLKI
jgi:hypothetical protein